MGEDSPDAGKRSEEQEHLSAERHGDSIHIQLSHDGTFSIEEYKEFLKQIRRTAWLTRDIDQVEGEETVTEIDGDWVGSGECHECSYEGYMVENKIGTIYCPKCRSTNVGWPLP